MTAGLTVGDFSRITHLSVKTLRHYHEVGLLEPATVNPSTGYRYYSGEQVPTAQVIRRLRDLEMPVSEVKAVLDAPDAPARNALIAAHLGRLEAELAQTRAAVDSLRNLLRPPVDAPLIEHRSVRATRAAGIAAVVDRADALPWWQGALAELHATVRAQGLHGTGPSGGVFASELFQHDRGEATVFIPVEGSVRAIGRVMPVAIPAAELAVITHRARSPTPISATPRSVPTPPGTRSASTGRCASTTCAVPATHRTRRNGGPRLAGPSSAPTAVPGQPGPGQPAPGNQRLRFPRGRRPGGSPRSSARPRSARTSGRTGSCASSG